MDITNPRRILAVSSEDSTQHLARVIKDLTGTHPEPTGPSPSLAGTTHDLALKTPYYTATVPIWLDLIASPSEWADSFLSAEAKEVLAVLGGVVVVFPLPINTGTGTGEDTNVQDNATAARDLIRGVGKVVKEGLGGWEWDGVRLCLGVGEIDDVDEWEDCCAEWGLEFVQVRSQNVPARNEFGEKTGIPRVLEALESSDWSYEPADDDLGLGSDFGDFEDGSANAAAGAGLSLTSKKLGSDALDKDDPDLDPESLDFGFDREDFAGLRRAIWNAGRDDDDDDHDNAELPGPDPGASGGEKGASTGEARQKSPAPPGTLDNDDEKLDEDEVQKLESMMLKLQAVRDMSAGLPEDQRKRMAAKAVGEVMREL